MSKPRPYLGSILATARRYGGCGAPRASDCVPSPPLLQINCSLASNPDPFFICEFSPSSVFRNGEPPSARFSKLPRFFPALCPINSKIEQEKYKRGWMTSPRTVPFRLSLVRGSIVHPMHTHSLPDTVDLLKGLPSMKLKGGAPGRLEGRLKKNLPVISRMDRGSANQALSEPTAIHPLLCKSPQA